MAKKKEVKETHTLVYEAVEPDKILQRAGRILKGTATFEDRFVPDHKILVPFLKHLRLMGSAIIATIGVWDLLHIGHLEYIALGKKEAMKVCPNAEHFIVVVGADTDELTRKRKGDNRPIVPQDERVKMLGHIRSVDIITLQYEFDQLYSVISPDVQIVSTSTKDLPADLEKVRCHCGSVVNLPPQAETSTTARVRKLSFDGAVSVLVSVERKLSTMVQEVRDEIGKK